MQRDQKIYSIAHRGDSSSCPDNTVIAFRKAAELAVDMIELDVQCTRDHVVVVIHDLTVDQTTNGSGYVCDFTLRDIQMLDAGSWFSPAFCGQRIPTLNETIEILKPTPVRLCIEIKGRNEPEAQQIVTRALEVIEANEMIERCILTSFKPGALVFAKQRQPEILTALDPDASAQFTALELRDQVRAAEADVLLQRHTALTRQLVDEMYAYGIPIWTWTVNEERDMRAAIDLQVEGIMTDHPARLHQLLSSPRR